jgi:glycosyltransferase involved in cell wall biosynthesis
MKFSIITVSLNSSKTIGTTIESVLSQEGVSLEYIIVDGLSKDGTVEIIKDYAEKNQGVIRWISEPDISMYDALNKGIRMATGDVIGVLNSDDSYVSNKILSIVSDTIMEKDIDSCYGNILYVKNKSPYRYWRAGKQRSFISGWMPPHPAFFVRKNIYERYGIFRLDCGTVADYELMLRLLEKEKISSCWVDVLFIKMLMGGISNRSLVSRYNAHINDNKAWNVNGLRPYFFTTILKKIRKLPQYISAKLRQENNHHFLGNGVPVK